MASFKLLADHYIGGAILSAGSVQFTADIAGGLLPANWTPTGDTEPLDSPALTLYYNAGPQFPSEAIRAKRADDIFAVTMPKTYWVSAGGGAYQLTGLGVGLPPKGAG